MTILKGDGDMKIVVVDQHDLSEKHLKELKQLGDVTVYEDFPSSDEEIVKRVDGAEVIATNWVYFSESILQKVSGLRFITVFGKGVDGTVDIKAATRAGIKVSNCPTGNSQAVAELALGLMLSLIRRINEASSSLREGKWDPNAFTGTELEGKRIGLIGYGEIGKRIAALADAFGMRVAFVRSGATNEQLDEIISGSDFVCPILPLTASTHHLIDRKRLKLMKKDAYLVNLSRGAITDQEALYDILSSGQIAGAALDVFDGEPFGEKPSDEVIKLANLSNVVATPHIAWNTREAFQKMSDEMIGNIKGYIEGQPVHLVN